MCNHHFPYKFNEFNALSTYSIEVFSLIERKSWILTVKFVAKLKLDYGNLNKIQFDEFAHEDNRHESYEITFSIFSKVYV